MCVSKLAHKGGYHFFLLLISLMWMACGSYSEKLHVIPGWQLELWAPSLSPGKGHYLQTLQDLVLLAACGHSWPPLSPGSRGCAAVGSRGGEGAALACDTAGTRLSKLSLQDGAPLQPQQRGSCTRGMSWASCRSLA